MGAGIVSGSSNLGCPARGLAGICWEDGQEGGPGPGTAPGGTLVPSGPGRGPKPGSHCSQTWPVWGFPLPACSVRIQHLARCPALLPRSSSLPSRPGLAPAHMFTRGPSPGGCQDSTNRRAADSAFVPSGSAEEIDIINAENLDCDVEIGDGPRDPGSAHLLGMERPSPGGEAERAVRPSGAQARPRLG